LPNWCEVALRWGAENPKASAAWIETLRGRTREQAIEGFVQGAANYEPQLAAQWALALPRENSRNGAIEAVASQWLNIDPVAAQAWLVQTALPEERKQKLLEGR
jgi:hypothetical protein